MADQEKPEDPADDDVRAEAEVRARDRILPTDPPLGPIAAVELYVEAFLAGIDFEAARRGAAP